MRILVEVMDSLGVEGRCAPDDAVNLICFLEQKLGQVRTVLTGDSSDECFFTLKPLIEAPDTYISEAAMKRRHRTQTLAEVETNHRAHPAIQ